ncbi:hypothetical protein HanOQP8_Chr15g0557971 [Helianthus annuus]|nr:hypothetical protein HanLR1_Chr15g0560011 [Helianthus annuus]KAJ0651155.1 hypothetical protein HanOQP8_Chr15g0557971 [Helianthus annuus]
MPLRKVQEKISQILYNGESIGKARLDGGKAKLLVGHNLEHDLDCLLMSYPDKLLRSVFFFFLFFFPNSNTLLIHKYHQHNISLFFIF